ncbi:hypothetical protein C8R43DRAFT_948407 [Mycena crocata]|nr:hypothetical protein C8R43DRAFT_948407 [Mycena crocata]
MGSQWGGLLGGVYGVSVITKRMGMSNQRPAYEKSLTSPYHPPTAYSVTRPVLFVVGEDFLEEGVVERKKIHLRDSDSLACSEIQHGKIRRTQDSTRQIQPGPPIFARRRSHAQKIQAPDSVLLLLLLLEMEYNLTEDTASPTSSPKPPPTATATSQLQASITTRRTRHRHTQSLGLLSPIPSSTSLCEQSRLSPHSSSPSPLRSTGHSPLRPLAATDSNTSTPSTRSASSHRSLSHKRTQSHSQASPYTAPHTPVAAGGPTPHTTPATTGNIQSATGNASGTTTPSGTKRASLPALLATLSALFPSSTTSTSTSASASMLPSPLSPTATSHNNTAIHYTAMQVASPQPRLGAMQPSNGTPQRPHTPSSRSEKLLRDALRRGSTSSPRPHVPSASSNPFAPVGHASHPSHHSHPSHPSYNNGHNGGSNATPAYGGDSEFSASAHHTSPSATALSHTLSRLEGRSPPPSQYGGNGRESSSPYGHGYGYGGNGNGGGNGGGNGRETREPRDPEHEALRARLERVLASGGGGSKPGSRRGSVNMRATSPLERERERERGQGQMSEWERLNERLGQERERERESTPRPRTPAMSDISEGSGAGTVGAGSPSPRTPTRARARGRTVDEFRLWVFFPNTHPGLPPRPLVLSLILHGEGGPMCTVRSVRCALRAVRCALRAPFDVHCALHHMASAAGAAVSFLGSYAYICTSLERMHAWALRQPEWHGHGRRCDVGMRCDTLGLARLSSLSAPTPTPTPTPGLACPWPRSWTGDTSTLICICVHQPHFFS